MQDSERSDGADWDWPNESPGESAGSDPDVSAEPRPRRRWSAEQKAQIVRESFWPGNRVSDVAQRYGLSRKQLSAWRTLARKGKLALATARSKDWNVYAKRPFRNTKQVFRYLSRYTHRIAIGDSRITGFDADNVAFRYRKPTRHGHRKPRYAITTVTAEEFIRRFLLHALPRGLHRIRHFGILANGCRAQTLDIARRALGVAEQDHHTDSGHPAGITEDDSPDHDTRNLTAPRPCPHCSGVLRHVREIPLQRLRVSSRDPPCTEPAQFHSR